MTKWKGLGRMGRAGGALAHPSRRQKARRFTPFSNPRVGESAVSTFASGNASVTTVTVAVPAAKSIDLLHCAMIAWMTVGADAVMGRRVICTGTAGSAPRTNGQNAGLVPALTVSASPRSCGVDLVETIQLAWSSTTPMSY